MPAPLHRTLDVNDRDLKDLRASGLNDKTIRDNGLRTEDDPIKVGDVLNWDGPAKSGGLVIPYRDAQGEVNCFRRVKPHRPRPDVKYEQPKGESNRAYFPAGSNYDNGPIFITEGEKKTLKLHQEGYTTIGLSGVYGFKVKNKDQLIPDLASIDWQGREVFIVFDYDTKPKTRRNVKHAKRALAKALRKAGVKCVRDVKLPAGLKGGKQGVDDFFVLYANNAKEKFDELVADADYLIADASNLRVDESTSRRVKHRREPSQTVAYESTSHATNGNKSQSVYSSTRLSVASFPAEVYPAAIREFVESMAQAARCPIDFSGSMLLAFASGLIGNRRTVRVKKDWDEPVMLWIVAIARSGLGKTPVFQQLSDPHWQIQHDMEERYEQAMHKWKQNGEEGKQPREEQLLVSDATIEALKRVIDHNPRGMLSAHDEASGWVRSMSQYKGNRGDDRQHWLSLFSGQSFTVNRAHQPRLTIRNPFVSFVGGIQPDALPDLVNTKREDGFSARLLFSYPDVLPAEQRLWTDETLKNNKHYADLCNALWDIGMPKVLTFDDDAREQWVDWYNANMRATRSDRLQPVYAKAPTYCARLAGVLHTIRRATSDTQSKKIDAETMTGATKLIEYFKSHAQRAYGVAVTKTSDDRISKAIRWIKDRGLLQENGTYRVTKKMIQQVHVAGARDGDEAMELLDDLAQAGYGDVRKEARNSVVFYLNPHDD